MSEEAEDAAVAFLSKLSPESQLEVLRRYEELLQVELDTHTARERRVAVALHQTSRMLGHPPSVREYKRLRHENPERGWPDPRSLTRWLGVRSWNDALVRMRLKPVLDGDTIESPRGPSYGIAEALDALRACADDLGRVPTMTDYYAWQHRPDVRERPGRRPASTWVFARLFGGFRQARVAAGLVDGEAVEKHLVEVVVRSSNYRLTHDEMLDGIREVAARTEGRLTPSLYHRERQEIYLETHATGHARTLAAAQTIARQFGNWAKALEAAEVDPRRGAAAPHPGWVSDEQIVAAMQDAYRDAGGIFTVAGYERWRDRELGRDPKRRQQLPTSQTMLRRYGGWRAAFEAAGINSALEVGRFTTQEICQALRDAESAAPGRLTSTLYYSWRQQQGRADRLNLRRIPSLVTILRRFESWAIALDSAGLSTEQRRKSTGFSDEELLRALRSAQRETRERLSIPRYRVWRNKQSAQISGSRRRIPSSSAIMTRFGGWSAALERVAASQKDE